MEETGKLVFMKNLPPRLWIGRVVFFGLILFVMITGIICFINALQWINKPFAGFMMNPRHVIVTTGQYHWTGIQEGIKLLDKILLADDRTIRSMSDLEEVVANKPVGEPVAYSIERKGEIIKVAIPTMRFTAMDLLLSFGFPFLSGIIYLLIGVIVFILKPDTKVSWAFLLSCVFLSIYTITAFDVVSTQRGFIRMYLFAEVFVPAAFIHFSLLFPEKREIIGGKPYLLLIPYALSTFFIIPIELFYPNQFYVKIHDYVPFYIVVSAAVLIASILHAYIRKSSSLARQRAKVILSGAAFAFPIPAIVNIFPHLGGTLIGVKIPDSLTAVPLLIFPASIAYAIAKHNLFDVDVYVKRAVGYGIMTAIVGTTYFSLQVGVRTAFQPIFGEHAEKIYPALFAVLIVFLYE